MAASPRWKVYGPNGEYVASCKYVSDAALLVSNYRDGAVIKDRHKKIVWREGIDGKAHGNYCVVWEKIWNTIHRKRFRVDAS